MPSEPDSIRQFARELAAEHRKLVHRSFKAYYAETPPDVSGAESILREPELRLDDADILELREMGILPNE